ncbi:hypothetical protein PC114_g23532 [Phytophthora cactorum]|nr:hypothetical protein PC114_g23532 [Phytophthora cactorum]
MPHTARHTPHAARHTPPKELGDGWYCPAPQLKPCAQPVSFVVGDESEGSAEQTGAETWCGERREGRG